MSNLIVEQPKQYVVLQDTRYTGGAGVDVYLQNIFPQDNFGLQAYVACTDIGCANGTATIRGFSYINTQTPVNKYWQGNVDVDHANESQVWPYGRYAPVGVFTGNGIIRAGTETTAWNMGPSLIPYSTLNVAQSPSAWSALSVGGATVTTGIPAPDGSTNGGEVVNSSGNGFINLNSFSGTTSTNDVFLFGGWEAPGTGETGVGNPFFGGVGFLLSTAGADCFQPSCSTTVPASTFDLNMTNGPWHAVMGMAVVQTGSGTSHQVSLELLGGNGNGVGNRFFMPCFSWIPASSGNLMSTIEMWRQNLFQGYCPAGLSATSGQVLAMNPSHKLYWGSDTNLYRSTTSTVKTDGAFIAGTSLQIASGTAMTGSQGNGVLVQHSTGTVTSGDPAAFDANGNTVNATAANVVGLFSTCSGIQYLGADGACHNTPTVPTKISSSITPAAATASSCVEQTFTYTGLATTQQVSISPPASLGVHLWIGWARVSSANTLAIAFCGDATAGTPASGSYIAVAF